MPTSLATMTLMRKREEGTTDYTNVLGSPLTIEGYLADRWRLHPEQEHDDKLRYFCPLHNEHTPSFDVTPSQQVWICRGACQTGGTLPYLITLKENVPFWQAYKIAGLPPKPLPESDKHERLVKKNPHASREERLLLTLAMHWWHARLLEQTLQAQSARAYLLRRGIMHRTMQLPQIGLAPYDPRGDVSALFRSYLQKRSGLPEWEDLSIKIGLLCKERPDRMRFQGRVTFSCTFPKEDWQEAWYIQGRTLSPSNKVKYLGASSIRKVPFALPVPFVALPTTIIVESPVGPAVLAGHGLIGMATLGEGLDEAFLCQFPSPSIMAHDNDVPRAILGKDGEVKGYTQPGEAQAEKCLKQCQILGMPAFRVRPPQEDKGVDEWVNRCGPDPLIAETLRVLAEHTFPLPNKWNGSVY